MVSRIGLVRTTTGLILVGLFALLAIAGTSLWLVGQTETFTSSAAGARQLRTALGDVRTLLQDAETSQRGFLLTRNPAYLLPYENARAKIPQGLAWLRQSAKPDPDVAADIPELETTVRDKMSEMQNTIDLAKDGRLDEALIIVKSDRGKILMDKARELLGRSIADTEGDIAAAVAEQRASVAYLRTVTLGGVLAVLLVIAGCVWAVVTYMRQLVATEGELLVLNTNLEERVQERTSEVLRANEEVQRFAYIVTHDLRAPLVNIMGFTSELEANLAALQAFFAKTEPAPDDWTGAEAKRAADEDLPEAISFIRLSTKKMDALINAILKLSREGRRTLKPERIDLPSLLTTAAGTIRHQIVEVGGSVDIEGKASLVSDRLSLEQIFGNLLENAFKYRSPDRPPKIDVRASEVAGGRIVVDVQDNGRGIAPQDSERVFELFRRAGKQDQPGEGIGLAHARALARNLGADITLRSTLGQGTTFRVDLPRKFRNGEIPHRSEPSQKMSQAR